MIMSQIEMHILIIEREHVRERGATWRRSLAIARDDEDWSDLGEVPRCLLGTTARGLETMGFIRDDERVNFCRDFKK